MQAQCQHLSDSRQLAMMMMMIAIWQMKQVRLREVTSCIPNHTTRRWQGVDSNPGVAKAVPAAVHAQACWGRRPMGAAAAASCPLFYPGATEWSGQPWPRPVSFTRQGRELATGRSLERSLKEVVGDTGFRMEKPGFKPRLCLPCGSVGLGPNAWPWVTQQLSDLTSNLQPHHQAWLAQHGSEVLKG